VNKINKIVFILTSECLHRCTYCFDRAYYPLTNINYTAEDVKIFLDINYDFLDEESIEIFIHGGDLLLAKNFDSILELLYNYKYPHNNVIFRFFFSTLPIETFTKYPILNISHIGVSIDGPRHVHNLNRKRIDGKNSFDELEYLLYMTNLPYLTF
jgi:sulfatase maturation enzyme AslB (radical SAM superfamily)